MPKKERIVTGRVNNTRNKIPSLTPINQNNDNKYQTPRPGSRTSKLGQRLSQVESGHLIDQKSTARSHLRTAPTSHRSNRSLKSGRPLSRATIEDGLSRMPRSPTDEIYPGADLHKLANKNPEIFMAALEERRKNGVHHHYEDDRENRRKNLFSAPSSHDIFKRPIPSKVAPLRSQLLDPLVNNLGKSETYTDFRRKVKTINIPHESYDIDGDGYVSQEDFWLAKRFDLNGDGVLDKKEVRQGKRILAKEFFENHEDDIHLYGEGYAKKTVEENVKSLSSSKTFQKQFSDIRNQERSLVNKGSKNLTKCLTLVDQRPLQWQFYTNKFNTTAWTDWGAVPRDPRMIVDNDHKGSREMLESIRKLRAREECQEHLDDYYGKQPKYSTMRRALITNMAIENS